MDDLENVVCNVVVIRFVGVIILGLNSVNVYFEEMVVVYFVRESVEFIIEEDCLVLVIEEEIFLVVFGII